MPLSRAWIRSRLVQTVQKSLRWCWIIAPFAMVLAANQPVAAQVPPRVADQATINSAIARGVQFLRASQNPSGGWGAGTKAGSDGGWAVGYAALAGITLIECGVPPSDPSIQAAARGIRSYVYELDTTYEVSLAILFLDRLGEKSDRKLIQLLAGRLIAGQSSTGGWGYKLPNKSKQEVDLLIAALRKLSPAQPYSGPGLRERPRSLSICIKECDELPPRPAAPPFDFNKARQATLKDLPPGLKRLAAFLDVAQLILEDPKDKGWDANFPTTDNSNTHFATLALWATRKYDVPTDRSFAMLANRFRTSQNADGTWSYAYLKNGENGGPGAMTCVALLGLAIGHVLNADPAVRPEKDRRVIDAFTALSKLVDEPAGQIDNRPPPESKGGLYFLWGMERIAVLYDLRQLDKKDWYLWGAEILLCHQASDGSWQKGGYHGEHPVLNTCFALLFLKRANLTPDLSRRLTVDASALTQRVNTDAPTPAAAPAPTPPEPTVAVEPPPQPKPRSVKPKVEAAAAAVVETPEPEPPPAPKSNLPLIIGLIVVGLAGGGCLAFALLHKRKDEEEDDEGAEEKRAKKRSGTQVKARAKAKQASKSKGGEE